MDVLFVLVCLIGVIALYFRRNPLNHSREYIMRRFINWFPLGMSYAFLYMARYNLNVVKNAMGASLTKEDFGLIFGVGTFVYGLSFLLTGPIVDKIGGKKGILIATIGASIANILMGVVLYLHLNGKASINPLIAFGILYSVNMFFQSYGATSIIKVKAYWFHVRERGIFGAIFGTLISFGVYFAFDWGQAIADAVKVKSTVTLSAAQRAIHFIFAIDKQTTDAIWFVFFIPAFLLLIWAVIDVWLIRDLPSQAGYDDFDTHDASSDEMNKEFTMKEVLRRVLTHPVLITVALIEFTSGVLRNGIMQWYFIFAKEIKQTGAEFFLQHWGFLMCVSGIAGSFFAGWLSDHHFHSRRGPPVVIFNIMMLVLTTTMVFMLKTSPVGVGLCAVLMGFATIGVHGIMSGTAAADFGGRKITATASGITDGFVYIGSGVQSVSLGFLTAKDWSYWPLFLIPFTILGLFFSLRMWKQLPAATKRYLLTVENVDIDGKESTPVKSSDRLVLQED